MATQTEMLENISKYKNELVSYFNLSLYNALGVHIMADMCKVLERDCKIIRDEPLESIIGHSIMLNDYMVLIYWFNTNKFTIEPLYEIETLYYISNH